MCTRISIFKNNIKKKIFEQNNMQCLVKSRVKFMYNMHNLAIFLLYSREL